MHNIVIIDHGLGNLKSVQRAFEKIGYLVKISSRSKEISSADFLILPGVGAFKDGMNALKKNDIILSIKEFVAKGKPFLGICLGMQMLLNQSEEYGLHDGLGYIRGKVIKIPSENKNRKIPHIGWNKLILNNKSHYLSNSIIKYISKNDYFYFVHSYMVMPKNQENILAYCEYQNLKINAAIIKDNIVGLQFHPEKSGEVGLKILNRFLKL